MRFINCSWWCCVRLCMDALLYVCAMLCIVILNEFHFGCVNKKKMEDALIQISFVKKSGRDSFFLRFHVKLKRHSVWFSDKKPSILYVNTTDPIFHACGFTWNFRWVCLPCYAASHIQHVQYTILAIIHRHPLFFLYLISILPIPFYLLCFFISILLPFM